MLCNFDIEPQTIKNVSTHGNIPVEVVRSTNVAIQSVSNEIIRNANYL